MKRETKYYIGIVIAMMLIQAGIMGIIVNPNGIIFAAILKEKGFRAGDLSIYYLIRSLGIAIAVRPITKLILKKNTKLIMALLGTAFALSVACMAGFQHLWQWYVAAAINGFAMCWSTTIIPMILNNWFKKKNGAIVGLTMASSGVVGMIYSPILSQIIERSGWRTASLISGLIAFVMIVLPSLFLVIERPALKQMKALGEDETLPFQSDQIGEKKAHAVPMYVFIISLVALIGPGTIVQFNSQLPTYANGAGYSLAVGAVLTSLSMAGNICSKLSVGVLSDKIGIYKAGACVTGVIAVSMIFFLFKSVLPMMYAGAFMFGFCYSVGTTVPSLLYANLYGKESYKDKVSTESSISYFVAAFLSVVYPYIFDFTGSFSPIFIYGAVICCVDAVLFLVMGKSKKS